MTTFALRARLALVAGTLALGACDADRVTAADPSLRRSPKNMKPAPAPDTTTVPAPTPTPPPDTASTAPAPSYSTVGLATLPLAGVNTAPVAPTGRTISVPAGGDLQGAINAAVPGDVVVLTAGATYSGNFYLPNKSGTGWVTIRTSTPDGILPTAGTRISPAQAGLLPKLVSPNGSAALRTTAGAHHYRIIGLEITAAPSLTFGYQLLMLGSASASEQGSLAAVPRQIIVDRSYIHGHANLHLKNCVELHAGEAAVIDSYVDQCHSSAQESHAIAGWNGPGPYRIENNYVAGAGINIFFGGADPAIAGMVPSDITVRRNHVVKPLAWKGVWTVKNLFELKSARRVLVEGNVFENSWVDGQAGWAMVLWSVNAGGGCTNCGTTDVTISHNVIRNTAGGFQLSERAENAVVPMQRVTIAHNVATGIGATGLGSNGRMYQLAGAIRDLVISHNTGLSTAHGLLFASSPVVQMPGLAVRDNIFGGGDYQIFSSHGQGKYAWEQYAGAGSSIAGNLIVGLAESLLPAGNLAPATADAVGFVGLGTNDLRLSASSPFKGRASDGTDPGADVASVTALTSGVVR